MRQRISKFDLRLPVGTFFCLYGLLVAGYGAFGHLPHGSGSPTLELDLIWEIVLFIIGAGRLSTQRHRSEGRNRRG